VSPAPTTAAQGTKRLHLLDAAEVAARYERPCFTAEERASYFALTPTEMAPMQIFTDGAVHAFFVLQLGYVTAKQRFFSVKHAEVRADLIFIVNQLDLRVAHDDLRLRNPRTLPQQRQMILDATRYRYAHAAERQQAYQVVLLATRISPKPQYLLRILLQFCARERMILEAIIGNAITTEAQRLVGLVQTHLTSHDCAALNALFEKQDGRYRLTTLQRAPNDRSHGQVRRERARGAELRPLYAVAPRVLPPLDLSPEGTASYASLVGYDTATRRNDLDFWLVAVYLRCFLPQC
jgi:hypothetical protein